MSKSFSRYDSVRKILGTKTLATCRKSSHRLDWAVVRGLLSFVFTLFYSNHISWLGIQKDFNPRSSFLKISDTKKLLRHVARVSTESDPIERSRVVSSVLFPHNCIRITFLDLDFKKFGSTWLFSQDIGHKKLWRQIVATVSQKWTIVIPRQRSESSEAKRMWSQLPQPLPSPYTNPRIHFSSGNSGDMSQEFLSGKWVKTGRTAACDLLVHVLSQSFWFLTVSHVSVAVCAPISVNVKTAATLSQEFWAGLVPRTAFHQKSFQIWFKW